MIWFSVSTSPKFCNQHFWATGLPGHRANEENGRIVVSLHLARPNVKNTLLSLQKIAWKLEKTVDNPSLEGNSSKKPPASGHRLKKSLEAVCASQARPENAVGPL